MESYHAEVRILPPQPSSQAFGQWLPAFADLRQIWVEAEALELSRRRVFRGRIGEQRNPIGTGHARRRVVGFLHWS